MKRPAVELVEQMLKTHNAVVLLPFEHEEPIGEYEEQDAERDAEIIDFMDEAGLL